MVTPGTLVVTNKFVKTSILFEMSECFLQLAI